MDTVTYLWFVLISIAVLVFPGPSILLIVANSLQWGMTSGLYTVGGGLAAMLIQLFIALGGLTMIAAVSSIGFAQVRWVGVAYLIYIGIQRWRGQAHGELRGRHSRKHSSAVLEGFVVALTNPGTMLFFVAFFPQFMNDAVPPESQLITMAATFMSLALVVDSGYALLSVKVGHYLTREKQPKSRNRLAGAIILAAALGLAWANL